MIKIASFDWSFIIDFSKHRINKLIIEDKRYFREIVMDIKGQYEGNEGKVQFSMNNKVEHFNKYTDFIVDIINLNSNNKKVLAGIVDKLECKAKELSIDFNKLCLELGVFFDKLTYDEEFELERSYEITIKKILKLGDFHIDVENDNLMDKVFSYMKAMRSYADINFFIFVNLDLYFSEKELEDFYDFIYINEFYVFCINSEINKIKENSDKNFKYYIIDKDLCEIF